MEPQATANEEQARYWDGDEAAHWLVHEQRHERMGAPFADRLLAAAAVGRADRVLDIGCGTGSTTRAAGRVAAEGDALGVDLSAAMLRRAARRAREEGLTNVAFEHGDGQVHTFTPGAGDVALSRFGVMFFVNRRRLICCPSRRRRHSGHGFGRRLSKWTRNCTWDRRYVTVSGADHASATKIIFWSRKTSSTEIVRDVFRDQNMIKLGPRVGTPGEGPRTPPQHYSWRSGAPMPPARTEFLIIVAIT
jgi:SAM-dependent methyltransferase